MTELGLSKWELGVSTLILKLNTPAVLRKGKKPNQQAVVYGISM
jgi:hypothetical protein